MNKLISKIILLSLVSVALLQYQAKGAETSQSSRTAIPGVGRPELYLQLLKGKRIALLTHGAAVTNGRLTPDILVANGLDVKVILSPEHGFSGNADAGAKVKESFFRLRATDERIPVVPLFRSKNSVDFDEIDAVVVDLQDVGLRFYTYYITMLRLMNEVLDDDIDFVVMDRPNPNGMYVDGPILDMKYKSGVGALPIPVVHGMTMGELALMINGEHWLKGGRKMEKLKVIPCDRYTHKSRVVIESAPSPNLPNMTAIYLYPSLCYFEAAKVSVGRGTYFPFQVYGAPNMKGDFSFTPSPSKGASEPLFNGQKCYGRDLRNIPDEEIISKGINLEYIYDAWRQCGRKSDFFSPFFEKLIGTSDVREMLMQGKSPGEIKDSWAEDIAKFKQQRKPYLLYSE